MSSKVTELRLQASCFQWHWNKFPEERGRLFMIHNNPRNKIDGNRLKAAGMVAGVADLEYAPWFSSFIYRNEATGRKAIGQTNCVGKSSTEHRCQICRLLQLRAVQANNYRSPKLISLTFNDLRFFLKKSVAY